MTTVNAMLTRTRPTTRLSVAKPPASFWYRFCALTLDFALVLGAAFTLAQLLNAVFSIGNEAVAWVTLALGGIFAVLDLIFLPVSNKGQSLGKQLVGIKIVAQADEELTVLTMAKRQLLGYPLSSFLLLGFISSTLDSEGQGWHDKLAKTRVIVDPRQTSANLYPAIVSSTLMHLLVGAAVIALIIILPFLFDALKIKFPDIAAQEVPEPPLEFTLVDPSKSAKAPAKKTRRASANSVAGGKRNPNRPVETGTRGTPTPRPTPTPRRASTPQPPAPAPVEPPTPRPAPRPRPIPKAPDAVLPKQEEPPTPKPSPELAPLSREPEPEPAPPAPPAPKRRATRSSNVGSSSSLASAPASALGGPLSARGSGGNGGVGESGRFNPDRDGDGAGVDAGEDVDFGPYMSELQRRVKRRWIAPEAGNSRRTVLLFSVSKDGRVSNLKVARSSGSASSDEAAKQAVIDAAPFKRLPAAYKNDRIDIQFTFDVNIFGDVDVGGRGF